MLETSQEHSQRLGARLRTAKVGALVSELNVRQQTGRVHYSAARQQRGA